MTDPAPDADTRRTRRLARDHGRHRGEHGDDPFQRSFLALGSLAIAGARVSASASDLDSGEVVIGIDENVSLPTADVGVVLLLIEVAAQLADGRLSPTEELIRNGEGMPGHPARTQRETGLWSSMLSPVLGVNDAATLVGAVRDHMAVNALIRRVGLDAIRGQGEALGLERTALLDLARTTRGPDDAPQFSVGSARELDRLLLRLVQGDIVDATVGNRVLGWLSGAIDQSLVGSAFGLDPVSHRRPDHSLQLVNLTGSDDGVRSEAGALRGRSRGVSYAVTATFDDVDLPARLRVIDAMRTVGVDLLEYVS